MTQFYTYMWLREQEKSFPAGTPYYVGKGREERAYTNVGHTVNRPKSKHMIIVQHWESEEKALEMEKWWISFWGRMDLHTGCLRNRTEGGEGTSGFVHSEEAKEKMVLAQIGRKASEETRRKMSIAATKTQTLERRDRVSRALKGRKLSDVTLEKLKFSLHIKWHENRGTKKEGCPACVVL
jgi:hypothetical protein